MTTIIAIDPGASGGIAWNSKGEGVQACAMPRDEETVVKLLREIIQANIDNHIVCYLEGVTGYVKPMEKADEERENRQPGHTMFKFGRGVGIAVGALLMARIEIEEVHPRTWQKPFYVNLTKPAGQRRSRSERKRVLRDVAQRRYPGIEVTLKIADALLIHAYGTMQVGQQFEGLMPEKRPTIPLAFSETHQRHFRKLRRAVAKVDERGDALCPTIPITENSRVSNSAQTVQPVSAENRPFYICNWQGTEYVMARDRDGGYRRIRVASAADLINLPRVAA